MSVLLVTSPNEKCGIREHSEMLEEAVLAADDKLSVGRHTGPPEALSLEMDPLRRYDIIHIDHQAALHAAWTPAVTDDLRSRGYKVVLTCHDTYETLNIMEDNQ